MTYFGIPQAGKDEFSRCACLLTFRIPYDMKLKFPIPFDQSITNLEQLWVLASDQTDKDKARRISLN